MQRLLTFLLLITLPGCKLFDGSGEADVIVFDQNRVVESQSREVFDEVRARWEAIRPADYTFVFSTVCYCVGPPQLTVSVRGGKVVRFSPLDATPIREYVPPTMDHLYAEVETALEKGRSVHFRYDPRTMLLAGYTLDRELMATDGGRDVHIRRLVLHR